MCRPPQGTSPRLSIGNEGRSSTVPLPNLQTGVATNLSSVAVCGRAALERLSLDLSQLRVSIRQRNTPLCPPLLSSACCQMLPKSSASVQQAGWEHAVESGSVVELLL